MSSNIETKSKFHRYENTFLKDDANIDNIFISKEISPREKNYKYFIGYFDEFKIKALCMILPKTIRYIKSYDGQTKWMYF